MLLVLLLAFLPSLQKAGIAVAAGPPSQPKEAYVAPFTPMPEPPKLPKIDTDSCPFEGCTFGKWTTLKPIVVYSTWSSDRKQIAELSAGEPVTALTGVNIVLQPGKGIFTRDVPMLGAKAGDTLYMYQDCGEGAADIWVHGRFIRCADPEFSWKTGLGCISDCNGRFIELGKSEWWAKIRLRDGKTGWVLVTDNFDGMDSLG